MKKLLSGGAVFAIIAYNAIVAIPVAQALSDETGVTMVAYRRWLVSPDTVVVDIWKMDGTAAMVDVDRNLFKAAEALKNRSYTAIMPADT